MSTFRYQDALYAEDDEGWDEGPFRVLFWRFFDTYYRDFSSLDAARSWCDWASDVWDDDSVSYASPQTIIDTRSGEAHSIYG